MLSTVQGGSCLSVFTDWEGLSLEVVAGLNGLARQHTEMQPSFLGLHPLHLQ